MAISRPCSFYRDPELLGIGPKAGYCDLDCDRTTCGGDMESCEKPDVLRISLSDQKKRIDFDGTGREMFRYPEYRWSRYGKRERIPSF